MLTYKIILQDFDNLPRHRYDTLTETIDPLHDRLALLNISLRDHGLEYIDVPRDGNCCFHASLYMLNQATDYPWLIPDTADDLRTQAVSSLRQHSNEMFEIDVLHSQLREDYPSTESPLESYREQMERNGTYADDIIITAISYLCNLQISIIQHDGTCICISAHASDEFLYPLVIGSIRDVHFVAVAEL